MEAYVHITGYVGTDVELRTNSSGGVASTPRYRKGDPVIVIGKLRTNVFKGEDGVLVERLILEATALGHDLTRGTSTFSRVERMSVTEDTESDEQAAIAAAEAQPRDPAVATPATATVGSAG